MKHLLARRADRQGLAKANMFGVVYGATTGSPVEAEDTESRLAYMARGQTLDMGVQHQAWPMNLISLLRDKSAM